MTDKEIIKALTIHIKGKYSCNGCPYISYNDCSNKILTDSLNLINRQQAEIEKARAEAIKEFADRLKEKFLTAFDSYAYVTYGDVVIAIENIVKEIGETGK